MKYGSWTLLLASYLLAGCSYTINKNPAPLQKSNYSASQLTYSNISEQVIRPACIGCHGPGSSSVHLDSYENLKLNLTKIQEAVIVKRSMPKAPAAPLSDEQLGLLNAWIQANAPEKAPDLPDPQPSIPLTPTFASIKYNILDTKCVQCHSPGGTVARIPLSTYADIINSPLELAIPGNAEESGLYLATIEEDERKVMPPIKDYQGNPTGFSKLSELEIHAIFDWIQSGAKE